jgi:hypothetical protein
LNAGDVDPLFHRTIEWIVLKTELVFVYLDPGLDIWWWTDDSAEDWPDGSGEFRTRQAVLEAEPIGHLTRDVQEKYRTLLGEAVARWLDEKRAESGLVVLDAAERYLAARNSEIARLWFLHSSTWTLASAITFACTVWLARGYLVPIFTLPGVQVLVGSCLGAVGAYLTAYGRLTSLPLDPRAGATLLKFEGSLRIFVGIFVAFFVLLAAKAKVLLGLGASNMTEILLLGGLAGATERAVPTLVKGVESSMGAIPAGQGATGASPETAVPPAAVPPGATNKSKSPGGRG